MLALNDRSAMAKAALALPLTELMEEAARLRDAGHGNVVSYSRKVFVPLTRLCRDVCHYCTFAQLPRAGTRAYLTPQEVVEIARAGAAAGCVEILFTLGDKPELRYREAREELEHLGYPSTIAYLAAMCELTRGETGLLAHVNPGTMESDDIAALRRVSVSQGIMLENSSERLTRRGAAHHGSPDKRPQVRLATICAAGELRVPFTSGILIGIGETREERLTSLLDLQALHRRFGHLQEIIIQNFRAKPATRMAAAPEPDLDDLLWTVAVARLIFGPTMNIQAPPNLSPRTYGRLIAAGLNDWGGISPVTRDHVNPEAPWPSIEALRGEAARRGKILVERLAVYPAYARAASEWVDPRLQPALLQAMDAEGFARNDAWYPGTTVVAPRSTGRVHGAGFKPSSRDLVAKAQDGVALDETEIVALFKSRGDDVAYVCAGADDLRRRVNGDVVTYVVNRNINYTNICCFGCQFCAFSKGKTSDHLRGHPYDLTREEVARRAAEAWERGATEVCMQGGIHPDYTGDTYLALTRTVRAVVPDLHIHAFSPLEVNHGARTLDISVRDFLRELKRAGLDTLPGTAAEILDDKVRAVIAPDKIDSRQWLEIVATAHEVGLKTTSTIMFGHMEGPDSWARHLIWIRDLQRRTGGLTEFVPLPFVHKEAPLFFKGRARKGPTFRETLLMHAVARLVLHPLVGNIQVSWVKLGPAGACACLEAGANDLGGTLMNESISRAAGTEHGQEMPPEQMDDLIRSIGRIPVQRTTLYGPAPPARSAASYAAAPLAPLVQSPPHRPRARAPAAM